MLTGLKTKICRFFRPQRSSKFGFVRGSLWEEANSFIIDQPAAENYIQLFSHAIHTSLP